MHSRRIASLAVLAAALAAPSAAAKGIEEVKACGAEGCRTVKSVDATAHRLVPPAGGPGLAPFYRLRIGFGDSGKVFHTVKVLWAPRAGMIANDAPQPQWVFADRAAQRLARRLTRGLRPYPAVDMPVALPPARVDETVSGDGTATTGGGGGGDGGPPWTILGGVAIVAAGAAALLARRRWPRLN
jgi:hypothetical protein